MDHHCPWIGNCVGYHNFKPFYLFCLYQCISGFVYTFILIEREFYSPEKIPSFSYLGLFCFWVVNLLDIPICFALIGLSVNIFLQIYRNETTLEGGGRNFI